MNQHKDSIALQNGEVVRLQKPVIISASRSTDIPAFYSDWFIHRFREGYSIWINPFNGKKSYVSFDQTRLIVFWSKNPEPILKHLDYLDERKMNYYFQFTLNDYELENLEPYVPSLQSRIETFIQVSEKIGKSKVIWRFDPLILTDKTGVDDLLRKMENIGNQLINCTKKLVFSFADIEIYKKVKTNLLQKSIRYREFDEESMTEIAKGIQRLNIGWNFEIGSCAEKIDLEAFGILHNKCIDDDLIIRLFQEDERLMDFLGAKVVPDGGILKTKYLKDKGQRKLCGCVISKDIGAYDTCPYLCNYCYANSFSGSALRNYNKHKESPLDESIKGA